MPGSTVNWNLLSVCTLSYWFKLMVLMVFFFFFGNYSSVPWETDLYLPSDTIMQPKTLLTRRKCSLKYLVIVILMLLLQPVWPFKDILCNTLMAGWLPAVLPYKMIFLCWSDKRYLAYKRRIVRDPYARMCHQIQGHNEMPQLHFIYFIWLFISTWTLNLLLRAYLLHCCSSLPCTIVISTEIKGYIAKKEMIKGNTGCIKLDLLGS